MPEVPAGLVAPRLLSPACGDPHVFMWLSLLLHGLQGDWVGAHQKGLSPNACQAEFLGAMPPAGVCLGEVDSSPATAMVFPPGTSPRSLHGAVPVFPKVPSFPPLN